MRCTALTARAFTSSPTPDGNKPQASFAGCCITDEHSPFSCSVEVITLEEARAQPFLAKQHPDFLEVRTPGCLSLSKAVSRAVSFASDALADCCNLYPRRYAALFVAVLCFLGISLCWHGHKECRRNSSLGIPVLNGQNAVLS